MTTSQDAEAQGSSTRPYLIRALHDWCTDNGFTPYLAVYVDQSVQVPKEYVKNNEIVLNVSFDATSQLQLGNEFIEFKARFGGVAREIIVPVDHVIAIYARENGQGMAFPVPQPVTDAEATSADDAPRTSAESPRKGGLRLTPVAETSQADDADEPDDGGDEPTPPPAGARPALRRVK
ncbi:ClpXP protease specificity-enhancing factor [Aquabacterium lacunae]|uniref:ClpXP protease specificity-enhancing factor n=1 Tax=Aquabacterium lacunae TaxID=2528630 RepID=A0A4Q9H516_9BURK|nr:ClpXP protease specificity-enhancing factor [Aquabacterium lacunae]TBO32764.1 ClpXP protease specificity-enhancing factor [Aquabacterium lacunae]